MEKVDISAPPPLLQNKGKEGAHDLPSSKEYRIKRENLDHLRSLLGDRKVQIPNWGQAIKAVTALI